VEALAKRTRQEKWREELQEDIDMVRKPVGYFLIANEGNVQCPSCVSSSEDP
jgi:hypothetical protein